MCKMIQIGHTWNYIVVVCFCCFLVYQNKTCPTKVNIMVTEVTWAMAIFGDDLGLSVWIDDFDIYQPNGASQMTQKSRWDVLGTKKSVDSDGIHQKICGF